MLVVAGFRFVVSGYAFSCIVTHCIYLSICGSCSGPVLSGTWLCIPVLCARRAPNSSFSANRFRIIFFRWTLHRDISQLGGWWWPPELCACCFSSAHKIEDMISISVLIFKWIPDIDHLHMFSQYVYFLLKTLPMTLS